MHQWQKQDNGGFKITSILDIASASKAEQLFPRDAYEAYKTLGYHFEKRQTELFCVILTVVHG